ncbi:MAG: 50S ribosomal protein L3 [Gammaproteobacteria bacterium]|nr:50S ribosomal protein L3 [Gammaproteobacteria bacterium]
MTVGIVGTKGGMTRLFDETGKAIPVTVIEAKPNRVVQVKTAETDAYAALQVAYGTQKAKRLSKAVRGHYKARLATAETSADQLDVLGRRLYELRTDGATESDIPAVGGTLTVAQFEVGQAVDVRGTSKGKGFAGTVKRWNFSTQDATHGNSLSHRAPGSVGQCQTPGKVFRGKKMAGQLGNKRVTVQNLQVVAVDEERDLLMVRGAVPGPTGGDVFVCPAIKDHADSESRS